MPPRPRPGKPGQSSSRPSRPRRPAPTGPSPARTEAEAPGLDRLQKVLAHAGVGSRRACEELITQGRVTVDDQVVRELGTKVDPRRARIAVDHQVIRLESPVYYAVNKPKGYVSTNSDPAGRPRVVDLLPEVPQRVYSVGRLDESSTGLILLTNDGELANRLAHPRYGIEKVYRALVAGQPGQDVLQQLVEGVWLAEGKARARSARITGRQGDATAIELVLAEGKNREVRRMLAKLGHKVMSLTRVSVGPVRLRGLKPGESRRLTSEEVLQLRRIAGLEPGHRPERPRERSRPTGSSSQRPRPTGGPRERAGGETPAARQQRPPHPRPSGPRPAGDAPPPRPARRPAGGPPPHAPSRPPRPRVDESELPPPRIVGMGQNTGRPRPPARRPARPATPSPEGPPGSLAPRPRLRKAPILRRPRRPRPDTNEGGTGGDE